MNTLEQEIMEKFHQLQPAAKQRVRALIEHELTSESEQVNVFDYAKWFHNVETLRQQIHISHGDNLTPVDIVGILRDIRDGEDE